MLTETSGVSGAGDRIDGVGNRQREEEPERKSCRPRGCKRSGAYRIDDARVHLMPRSCTNPAPAGKTNPTLARHKPGLAVGPNAARIIADEYAYWAPRAKAAGLTVQSVKLRTSPTPV